MGGSFDEQNESRPPTSRSMDSFKVTVRRSPPVSRNPLVISGGLRVRVMTRPPRRNRRSAELFGYAAGGSSWLPTCVQKAERYLSASRRVFAPHEDP